MSAEGKVIIAGAGLSGLTAAACLLQAGFDVEVYEQAARLGEIGAGIQQSANSTHVMRHLGILDRLLAVAYRPPVTRYHVFNTGEVLREQPLAEIHEERYGGPYLQLHRADFHAILAARVRELRADAIHLNAAAIGVEETSERGVLRLADGRAVEGDLVIGADGIKSVIRRQIADPRPPEYTGNSAWRLTVPTERLPANFLDGTFSLWLGPAKHAVVYFVRGGALLNFVGAVELDEWIDESWTLKRPWEELKADFEGWHPHIQAIVDAVDRDECYRWALNVHPALDGWSTGRITLLGDAAHPTLPYLAQGAAMG
ncbi:MAG TPA: FAD-dependent monooxygenase, partial [Alphaproteobacteria bacterium]|nr:FAD-dependent monooxygenase [Alphaproteobacteria bacterium]